ncbi:unnamed protein product [Rotaria sordida]|nr:unnamed protein product [Rotaria sordida]CAF1388383.1 unnamed protein product [Rotaria sordida]CAF1398893.1 unnamed protein product [Rotaria sordida]CAF3976000.1 unnamed protein product [Rotaria sordida]
MFPQLQTLSLINFIDRQLNLFLDKITDLSQLVKLDVRNLRNGHEEGSLEKILTANNNRLKFVLFDYDSINFILNETTNDEALSYSNIEELAVNIKTHKTLAYLFTLVPDIRRLHVDFDQLSFDSKLTLANVSSLIHLKDFQLRSINTYWSLDEIAHILSKMPFLQRLALDLCTEDVHFVDGQNFIRILPSSIVEIHLFIIYYFFDSHIDVDTLLSTWSIHVQITCLLDEPNEYAIIHTIPCDLSVIFIPATIAKSMLTGSKYTRKQIVHLEITDFQECASIPIGVIAQKFNHLRDLSLFLESPTVFVDSLILQVLSLWRDKNLRGFYIKGLLTDEISKNLRQWLIDHSHLRQEDSFIAEYDKNWTDIWLQ